MNQLKTLEHQLDQVLLSDRARLKGQLARLRQRGDSISAEKLEVELSQLRAKIELAVQRCDERQRHAPAVNFELALPILDHREQIGDALRHRQTLVVAGETGSGKSTQLPKILLDAGWGRRGMIGHTQPRRIAARSVAARIAEELGVPLGRQVGFKIRFHDKTDSATFVKLMTDGVLLAETQRDRHLEQYEVVILDEAHERSLNIDFLLGYLKRTLPRRPDLRVIITSATIDAERFSDHFTDAQGPAPIIEVSGRGYPIEVRYHPLVAEEGDDVEWAEGLIAAVHEVSRIDRGDILIFLPTERDIREAARLLRGERFTGDGARATEVLPLYARLSASEQNRIFQPASSRRIVLATNVAESSLTVPNIRYVIDTGTARISRYSPRSKVLRLPIEPISQASANQRAGRCGRVAPGICIRLYGEDDFQGRDAYTTPEVRRTNLASVILQAMSLRLGEIEDFPFLDPPREESIRDGYKTLYEIRATDRNRQITDLGRRLARMPVDPRIGRMILGAHDEGCLHETLIIAAAIELQDPRERPQDKQQQADERHEQFADPDSDFVSYLKIWDFYHHLKESISRSKSRRACQQNYLSYNRLREWTEIHRQLLEIVKQQGLKIGPRRDDYAAMHRALLSGLLSGVAYRSADREYTGAGGLKMNIWPGSGLFRQRHAWVVAAERVETSRRYARTVARISPTWIEPLADHLVKRSYSDPHWHHKSGTVMAYEKVSLMGMPVVVKRRVNYSNIDQVVSRRIFIDNALVPQDVAPCDDSVRKNRQVLEEIERLAARTRRREYMVDEYTLFAFYNERLPNDVCDVASLRRWLRADPEHRDRFRLKLDDLIHLETEGATRDDFPDHLSLGNLCLPVAYNFNAGAPDDGVTIRLPADAANQIDDGQLEWLVPGLLTDKIVALIRSLPKSLRRNFIPVADTARDVVSSLSFGEGPLLPTLASTLSRIADEKIEARDFQLEKLPDHLRMNIQLVDAKGEPLQMGRDLKSLLGSTDSPVEPTAVVTPEANTPWQRDGLTVWDLDEFPGEVAITRGGIQIAAFPALVDRVDSVSLRLLDTAAQAKRVSRRGVARLYLFAHRKSIRSQIRWLPRWDEISVWASSLMTPEKLRDELSMRIADLAFVDKRGVPRSQREFDARAQNAVESIAVATQEVASLLPSLFAAYHRARLSLEELPTARQTARADLDEQFRALFDPQFLVDVPWSWLQQYPRFLDAISYRVEKLGSGGAARDKAACDQVSVFWSCYLQQQGEEKRRNRFDPELDEFRWMIEELRVSLFAQHLGTSIKISPQRLEKQWRKIQPT